MASFMQFRENGLFIFTDESQNLGYGKSDPLTKILTEGRKFNTNICLATQYIPSTPDVQHRLAQCDLIACFKPSDSELERIVRFIDPTDTSNLRPTLRRLSQGEYVAAGNFPSSNALSIDGIPIRNPLKLYNDMGTLGIDE